MDTSAVKCGHCRDGSGSEDSNVCSIEKPRAGGPEHPDGSHPLSQAICCARWRRGNQHSHLEFLCFSISCAGDSALPALPAPTVARRCNPNCLSSSLTPLKNEQIWLWTPFGCNRGLQIRCSPLAETGSTRKWQNYTFQHSVPRSPSLLRNIRHHSFLMSWSFTNQCCCSLIC